MRPKDNELAFKWSDGKRWAAEQLAKGELSYLEIARHLDINETTLASWRRHPDFAIEVERLSRNYSDAMARYPVGIKVRRLRRLQERLEKLDQIAEERGAAADMDGIPGGRTGFLVITKRFEPIPVLDAEGNAVLDDQGRRVMVTPPAEVELDAGLLKEMREVEKQAAIESGQWDEGKREADITQRLLAALARIVGRRIAGPGPDPAPLTLDSGADDSGPGDAGRRNGDDGGPGQNG